MLDLGWVKSQAWKSFRHAGNISQVLKRKPLKEIEVYAKPTAQQDKRVTTKVSSCLEADDGSNSHL